MSEVIVGGLSVLIGTLFSIRAWWRILKEKRAARVLGLKGDTPEWTIIMEKWITVLLVVTGQILMGLTIVMVLFTQQPRPPLIREFITWSIVAMPVILGALSIHAELSYQTEMRVLKATQRKEK